MTVRLSRAAERDLEAFIEEGGRLFGIMRAESYALGLFKAFETMAAFPEIGVPRDELGEGVRSLRHRSHVVLYRDESDLGVLRIRHVQEDWLD